MRSSREGGVGVGSFVVVAVVVEVVVIEVFSSTGGSVSHPANRERERASSRQMDRSFFMGVPPLEDMDWLF